MAIFKGRVRVRYGYSRWGYTRNNGKGWHGGSDEEGLDSTTIRMPDYKGKSISGRVVTARKVDRSTGSKTWEWGWYVCVELDAGQTPDAVNYLYFCHNAQNLVSVGQRVKSGDALALMGVVMYVFAPEMIGLLSPVDEIRTLGTEVLRIEAFAEPFFAAAIVSYSVCVGAGDTLRPSIINLGSMWFVRLTLAAAMAPHFGLRGVWVAMAIELTVRGLLFLWRIARGKWLKMD